jgi:hypothetical protein
MFIHFTVAPGACQGQLPDGCIGNYINDFRSIKLCIGIKAGFSTANPTAGSEMI